MAQTKNLGKVTITPRGVYSPSSAYERLDAVTYDGSSWLALQNVTGLAPTPGQYWMLISAKGDKGDTGDVGDTITVDGVSEVGGNIQLNAVRYSAMSLSAANKKKARENIDAQETMTIDTAMSDSSTNAVQNSTITDYIESSFSVFNNTKAPAIYDSVGPAEIVTVSDGAGGMDASSVVVAFSPIQAGSGDPSPSNIRPISGRTGLTAYRTGVNLWDEEWESGRLTSALPTTNANMIRSKNFIPVLPNTVYFAKKESSFGNMWGSFYDENKTPINPSLNGTNIGGLTFTTPNGCYYMRFFLSAATAYTNGVSINYPAIDTAYHAYTGASYPVSWQSEAGTVYGGTLDLVSGVLTIDKNALTLDGTTTGKKFTGTWTDGNSHGISSYYISINNAVRNAGVASDMFTYDLHSYTEITEPYLFPLGSGANVTFGFSFPSSTINTMGKANEWLANNRPTIVYKTTTPQTYQLTPTQIAFLLGYNCLWSDCDEISAVYPCDTKLYIDEKTAALLAILSE